MREDIKRCIEQKDFKNLENILIEMVEQSQTPLDEFFEIAGELKKIPAIEQAYLLLEILASEYETLKAYDMALEVYKQMPYFTSNDSEIRKKLAHVYRILYKNSTNIEDYLDLSGIERGEHFFKSLEKLDEFLKYDIGKLFYFEKHGIGEIKEVMPAKKEFVIDFEKHPRYFIKFDIAQGLLMPITTSHFLYKKQNNLKALQELAATDPLGLTKLIISSFHEPLTTSLIKNHLAGIIDEAGVDKWWDKVRKPLESDPNIRTVGKAQKRYEFVESGIDRTTEALNEFNAASPADQYLLAEEYSRKYPALFDQIKERLMQIVYGSLTTEPALVMDIMLLFKDTKSNVHIPFTLEDIFKNMPPAEIVHRLVNASHQRFVLDYVQKHNPDNYQQIFKNILLASHDARLMSELEEKLNIQPAVLKEAYDAFFLLPHNYPDQFQWVLKKMARGELKDYLTPNMLPRIISSMDHVKGIKSTVKKLLNLEDFDLLLKNADVDAAKKILTAVQNSTALAEYEKRDFLKILEYHFPILFKKEDFIYATSEALEKKKEELGILLNVEIPANKKDISRAREHGDLSENFEYKAAKEKQDQLYQKVRDIEQDLPRAKLIDAQAIDITKVSIGTRVSLKNKRSGQMSVFTILGRWD